MRAAIPKQKLIIIVGPNASGKSALAVRLAKKFNGEIISADSRQVYQGLDIGTGKVPHDFPNYPQMTSNDSRMRIRKKFGRRIGDGFERYMHKGIPHHCIDFASPKKTFTVAEYKKCAEEAIRDIASRKKLPILVGGTGFWIDAVAYDIDFPAVPPNPKLRKRLEKKSPAELLKILRKLDPERARTVEQKNPRRLIRAIEIAKALGKVPKIKKRSKYQTCWIGVSVSRDKLRNRIHRRLLRRMKAGMIEEAKKLRRQGLAWKRFYELGLEYKFLADYLRGKIAKREMITKLERAINEYARRQMTWFKKNRDIRWVRTANEAEKLTRENLSLESDAALPESWKTGFTFHAIAHELKPIAMA